MMKNKTILRSKDIHWREEDEVIKKIMGNGVLEEVPSEDLFHLVKELDRRTVQLWDKVSYEREKGLVDYSKEDLPRGTSE